MNFEYTWEITGIKCIDQENHEGVTLLNSVCQTYWKLTGTDSKGNQGVFSGATPFCASKCGSEKYCEFSELTEAVVLSWVQDIVANDASYKEHIDAQIQKTIDATKITEPSLPWAPVDEEPAE